MQLAMLNDRLLLILRQSDPAATLSPDGRAAALVRLFMETFSQRARVQVPVPPGARIQPGSIQPEEMEAALLGTFEITDDQLAQLAHSRAQRVVEILSRDFNIAPDRLAISGEPPLEAGLEQLPGVSLQMQ
jgi:hypothetical protein